MRVFVFSLLLGLAISLAQSVGDLERQGAELLERGQYKAALEVLQKALPLREQASGTESLESAVLYLNLGDGLFRANRYSEAEAYIRKALSIQEKLLGQQHARVAESYRMLGNLFRAMGKSSEAEGYLIRALSIAEKTEGLGSTLAVKIYINQSRVYRNTFRYKQAEEVAQKAVLIGEQATQPSIESGRANAELGVVYTQQGQYQKAYEALIKAVDILEKSAGLKHPETAWAYGNLAEVQRKLGRFNQAESLYKKALPIIEEAYGSESGSAADLYHNISLVYSDVDDYTSAFESLNKGVKIQERLFGTEGVQTADYYRSLSHLYMDVGNILKAAELRTKAWRIYFENFGLDDLTTGDMFHDQAISMSVSLSVADEAYIKDLFEYYEEARKIYERVLGIDHPNTILLYNNMAADLTTVGRTDEARTYLRKVLEARLKTYPSDHPELGYTYLAFSAVEARSNHFEEALRYANLALSVREKALGKQHRLVSEVYRNIGRIYDQMGKVNEAIPYMELANKLQQQRNLDNIYPAIDTYSGLFYTQRQRLVIREYLELLSKLPQTTPTQHQTAFGFWLTQKGIASSVGNGLSRLRDLSPSLQPTLEQYRDLSIELAYLLRNQPENLNQIAAQNGRIEQLSRQRSDLERTLSAQSVQFRSDQGLLRVQPQDVQAFLREGEVYVDFAVFPGEVYAFTLDAVGKISLFALGDSKPLLERVQALRTQTEQGASLVSLRPLATALYDQLLRPLAGEFGTARTLVVSPDDLLNFLPFELLSDGQRLLLERFDLRYLASGRELVRLGRTPQAANLGPAAIFGNPDFGSTQAIAGQRGGDEANLGQLLSNQRFAPLPATEGEAKAIAGLLGPNQLFLGAAANEQNLLALRSPRVLHLATHGFFVPQEAVQVPRANPQTYVGIALSGARVGVTDGQGVGLVSGLQLSQLSLQGTELVVLSACDTGLGDFVGGEGVAGLAQAFMQAGASRVLLSLWKVPDQATADLMTDFYRRWRAGADPAQAVRQSKLAMLQKGLPPRDWAAFVLSGR